MKPVPQANGEGAEEEDDDEETKSDRDTREQLERGLADATTFDNMHEKIISPIATPPGTPGRTASKRESGGGGRFPQISIPKLQGTFWQSQVNSLR